MEEFDDLQQLFIHIIEQSDSADMAQAEFSRTLVDDVEVRRTYRRYCRANGLPERLGFASFYEEYQNDRNEVWNNLQDFDDIE